MSEFNSFINARLKVERAKKHINDLDIELRTFLKTDFYDIRVDKDGKTGNQSIKLETKPVPASLGLIVGDAIHNARAALDLLVSDAFRQKTGVSSDFIKFPFYETRERLVKACAGGDIEKTGTNAVQLITDMIKPYRGGDDILYALHDLDILDKHLLLLPHISIIELSGLNVHDDNRNTVIGHRVAVKGGEVRNIIGGNINLYLDSHGEPTVSVFFGNGLPLENQPIIPTLVQFTEHVSRTIDAFETL